MKKLLVLTALVLSAACGRQNAQVYTLKTDDVTLTVTSFGGRVMTLCTKDRDGKWENIVAGHKTIKEYVNPVGERFFGACVGPVANRISNAQFTLDGETYYTPANNYGKNTLHGGFIGIDNMYWNVRDVTDTSISFSFLHPDLMEGFPGNLSVEVDYILSGKDFKVQFRAKTDKPTPVNLTHHPFFCLRGQGVDTVEPYELWIKASHYIPIDAMCIPTGEIAPVEGTPFDFREVHTIGERIPDGGYDHNWCIDKETDGVEHVCTVYDPVSGRQIDVFTDQSGLQIYSGNFFDGTENGSNGKPLSWRSSMAIEAQGWPDAVNNPQFPDCILRPGEEYTSTTIYSFSTR